MHFGFTQEQILFRDSVGTMLQAECTPDIVRKAWSNPSGRTPEIWNQLAQLGVLGITAPQSAGGLGMNEIDLVLIIQEAGRVALPEPIVESIAVGLPLLAECDNIGLRDHWSSSVISGESVISVGLEHSPYVAHAAQADLIIIQRDNELHALQTDQVRLIPQQSVDHSRKLFSVDYIRNNNTILAGGKEAQVLCARAFNRGALGTAAFQLGVAQAMIDLTVEYTKVREQFGKPIGTFQAIKHMMSNALLRLEFAKPVVYRAAYSLSTNHPDSDTHVSMAKIYGDEAAYKASKACLQAHGAIGYTFEHDLHLWMKRCWSLQQAWGNAAWHRERVGKAILD